MHPHSGPAPPPSPFLPASPADRHQPLSATTSPDPFWWMQTEIRPLPGHFEGLPGAFEDWGAGVGVGEGGGWDLGAREGEPGGGGFAAGEGAFDLLGFLQGAGTGVGGGGGG